MRPSLLAGAVLCWARALGEFGATITFAGNFPGRTQTMPLAVYLALESRPEAGIVLSLVLLAISLAVLVALRRRWLDGAVSLDAHVASSGATPSRSTSRSTSRRARWSPCSARTAPARRRCCARWPASMPLDAGRIVLDGVVLDDVQAGIVVAPERRPVGVVFQDSCSSRT